MALPPYMTTSEKVSYYGLRIFVGLVLLFLIAPILAIMPLSFNSEIIFQLSDARVFDQVVFWRDGVFHQSSAGQAR